MASAVVPGMVNVLGNQPVLLQQANARRGFTEKHAKVVSTLGAMQLAAGSFAIVFQAAATGIENNNADRRITAEFVGCGIWCGIMFVVGGLLGVLSGKRNKTSLIVAFLVINIVISVMVWVLVGFAAANLAVLRSCPYRENVQSRSDHYTAVEYNYYAYGASPSYRTVYSNYYYSNYFQDCSLRDGVVGGAWQAMDSLLLILAIFEFAIAVTSAAYCCRALSCCCNQQAPVFVLQQSAGPAGAYQYGPSMHPIFLQQGPSIHGPVFTNPMMVAGPVGYSTGDASVQLQPQFVHEAMPSAGFNGASTSSGHCAAATPNAPCEQVYKNDPNAPPNYYELTD